MSYAASDYDDESVDAGDDERLLTSRGLGDAVRLRRDSSVAVCAGRADP